MVDICTNRYEILVPPHILSLTAYEPGLSAEDVQRRFGLKRVIKLASNENPLGVPPLALPRARQASARISRYPSGSHILLISLAESVVGKASNATVRSRN